MAAPAAAPKLCNVLSPLDSNTLKLIRNALPIAQELYEADNERFAALRLKLLTLYGDDAAPKLLDIQLLGCANEARAARLVDESFVLGIIMLMAAAKASTLRDPATRAEAATAQHEVLINSLTEELEAGAGLRQHETRSAHEQLPPPGSHWSSMLENITLPIAETTELTTAVAALTLLIAELDHSYKLKLGETLRNEELIATMAMLEASFVGASNTARLSAMRWLQFRALDMGWSVELLTQDGYTRAVSHCSGLDGYGRNAIANLRDFRSPAQLIAYKSFAGFGVVKARGLHAMRVPLCSHLRSCMSLATYAHKEGCELLSDAKP